VIRYLITDGSGCLASVRTDVDIIQIREPQLSARELATAARSLLEKRGARTRACRILINDRADVAIATGADGVHLKSNWPAVCLFRKIAPPGFIVSVACHSIDDVRRAADKGADYAVLAPIFQPLSKPDSRPLAGLKAIREAAQFAVPIIALGGITEQNAADCIAAGAAGVAGISMWGRRFRLPQNRG
jgi:thiamine-phosphate pyrophosphorylase